MVIIGTLKAAGKTTTSMFLAIFHTLMLLTFSLVLAHVFHLNELGIWIAYPVANLLAASLAFYFYRQKHWLKKELI